MEPTGRVVVGVLAVSLAVGVPAAPNGGTVRVAKAPAGPYLVSAWSQPEPPRVGRLDVSVAVMRPVTEDALLDARVTATAEAADGKAGARAMALVPGGGGNPLYYHALFEMPAPGRWRVTLAVEGPAGAGRAAFDLDVQPARSPVWTLVPAFLLGLGGLWWVVRWWRRQAPAGGPQTDAGRSDPP